MKENHMNEVPHHYLVHLHYIHQNINRQNIHHHPIIVVCHIYQKKRLKDI